MLLRIALFFVLAYCLLRFFTSLIIGRGQQRNFPNGRFGEGDKMVLDPQCKSYLPKGDAIQRKGEYFCSEECARLYLSR